jgi:uncharacterized membrane protein
LNPKLREGGGRELPAFFPALIGAAVSVGLNRSGLPGFLFLLPLGINAFCFSAVSARQCAFFTIAGNSLFALWTGVFLSLPFDALILDIVYFSVIVLGFVWIIAPPALFKVRTVYRLVAASVAGALILMFFVYVSDAETGFLAMFRSQAEFFVSLYNESAGADVVEQSLASRYVNVNNVMAAIVAVSLRGGAVFSCMLLFFVSRQLSLFIARIVRRPFPDGAFVGFHASPRQIWALSFSLAALLISRLAEPFARTAALFVEIASWNVLVICVMLYTVQGGAILLYWYSRRAMPPLFRFFLNFMLIIVIFSPGINAVLLAALVLLGIAENWVPFRVSGTDGSSPTPGNGE